MIKAWLRRRRLAKLASLRLQIITNEDAIARCNCSLVRLELKCENTQLRTMVERLMNKLSKS